jgi:hypothetical protein
MTRKQNISAVINRMADKHDLNVTVVRDLIEDFRQHLFDTVKIDNAGEQLGFDLYRSMRDSALWYCKKLSGGSRKPAKRKAGK